MPRSDSARFGVSLRAAAVVAGFAISSCGGAVAESSRVEDKARRDIPIAICRRVLAQSDLDPSGQPLPLAYYGALVKGFGGFGRPLPVPLVDCAGNAIGPWSNGPHPSAGSRSPSPTDVVVVPNGDGTQTVWLSIAAPNGLAAGPLAIVRARATELDVYALGSYAGSAHHSRVAFARLGADAIVVAYDDACADGGDSECESKAYFHRVGGGQIVAIAKVTTARVHAGILKQLGPVQFRLSTDPPVFDDHAIHIKERLSVRGPGDDEVRRSQGERVFQLHGAELKADSESVWAQVPPP